MQDVSVRVFVLLKLNGKVTKGIIVVIKEDDKLSTLVSAEMGLGAALDCHKYGITAAALTANLPNFGFASRL